MKNKFIFGMGMGIIVGGVVYSIIVPIMKPKHDDFYNASKTQYLEKTITSSYNSYIKEDDLNNKELVEGIYRGFVYGTEDPYTNYLDAKEFEKTKVMNAGDYVGTGIKFAWGLSKQYLIVTEIIPSSPAAEAGINVGDKIVAIDGIRAIMSNQVEIAEKLTNTSEKPVIYTIQDNSEQNEKEVSLQSRAVTITGLTSKILDGNILYLKLDSMKEGISSRVTDTINTMKDKGINKMILDIRGLYANNLDETQKLCDLFLEKGNLFKVAYANKEDKTYTATQGSYEEELAVITDNYTLGTIEAFVEAIKGQKRGVIIGETTGGKGTVEELIPLEDGSGLMISTGKLYGMNEYVIEEKGIAPDIEIKTPMTDTLQILTKGSLPLENDTLVQKAINTLK